MSVLFDPVLTLNKLEFHRVLSWVAHSTRLPVNAPTLTLFLPSSPQRKTAARADMRDNALLKF